MVFTRSVRRLYIACHILTFKTKTSWFSTLYTPSCGHSSLYQAILYKVGWKASGGLEKWGFQKWLRPEKLTSASGMACAHAKFVCWLFLIIFGYLQETSLSWIGFREIDTPGWLDGKPMETSLFSALKFPSKWPRCRSETQVSQTPWPKSWVASKASGGGKLVALDGILQPNIGVKNMFYHLVN